MTIGAAAVLALAILPVIAAVVSHVRMLRDARRLREAMAAEQAAERDELAKRESFSQWPFPPR